MDDHEATLVAESWSGDGGLVPRGPLWLLAWGPAERSEVERHTGRRPGPRSGVWRLEVGGRFLRSGGVVYPGGVPFPEALQRRTAVVSSEVWLYVDDDLDVLGCYSWPEAVRRPIASVPRADFDASEVVGSGEAAAVLGSLFRLPEGFASEDAIVVEHGPDGATVFLAAGTCPDPLNEMLLFEEDGLSLRIRRTARAPDLDELLRGHQPPYRRVRVGGLTGMGREPGRALGPQTWPWPGELLWWTDGASYELKGFASLASLTSTARTLEPVVA